MTTAYAGPLRLTAGALLCLLAALLVAPALEALRPAGLPSLPSPAATAALAGLPLQFVANAGQTDPAVRFQARALGGSVFFTPGEVVLALPAAESGQTAVLRLRFSGANLAPTITGAARQPGTANYFTGADRARWRTDVPTYGAIVYHQLYDGVDLHYDGELGQLKGTYQVAASADPGRIHWRYDGAASTRIDADGSLRIMLPASAAGSARTLVEAAPIAWQEIGGRRVPVDVRYALAPDGSAGFALGAYDMTRPLTIDPALRFSTYLGGSGADYGYGIATDDEGNVYVAGVTASATFPTVNPLQPTTAAARTPKPTSSWPSSTSGARPTSTRPTWAAPTTTAHATPPLPSIATATPTSPAGPRASTSRHATRSGGPSAAPTATRS